MVTMVAAKIGAARVEVNLMLVWTGRIMTKNPPQDIIIPSPVVSSVIKWKNKSHIDHMIILMKQETVFLVAVKLLVCHHQGWMR